MRDKLDLLSMHRIDLTHGAVLEKDCVYIVPLLEYVSLRQRTSAAANPKSSTGRLDVFARVITDYGTEFDRIREGYKGPLFAEISPRAFSILVRTGSRLVQLRIRRGSPGFSDTALRRLHEEVGLVDARPGAGAIRNGLAFTVDVAGDNATGIVGYKARRHTDVIDIDRSFHYDPRDFWEAVYPHRGEAIILDPNDFYILASREAVVVPPDHAAEMLPYDTFVGEFRVHYAGFFDPGFGAPETGGAGSRAVLEVRSHEVPFLIEHGQIVGRLVYERLDRAARQALRRSDRFLLSAPGFGAVQALRAVRAALTGGCPALTDLVAVAQQPIEGNQRVAAFDGAVVEDRLDFGEGLDDDADVLVLLGEAVNAGGGRRINPAAEQKNALVGAAGGGHVALDWDRFADQR